MKKLSYENIQISDGDLNSKIVTGAIPYTSVESLFDINWNRPIFKCVNDSGETLAQAKCKSYNAKEFNENVFYSFLVENEVNYTFNEILTAEERKLTNDMPLADYVNYVSENYPEDSDTLTEICNMYFNLKKLGDETAFVNFVHIDWIEACEGHGAGMLLVNALKEKYSAIFLYSDSEVESYWKEKHNFKEILNGHLYWSDNKELNKILG